MFLIQESNSSIRKRRFLSTVSSKYFVKYLRLKRNFKLYLGRDQAAEAAKRVETPSCGQAGRATGEGVEIEIVILCCPSKQD